MMKPAGGNGADAQDPRGPPADPWRRARGSGKTVSRRKLRSAVSMPRDGPTLCRKEKPMQNSNKRDIRKKSTVLFGGSVVFFLTVVGTATAQTVRSSLKRSQLG